MSAAPARSGGDGSGAAAGETPWQLEVFARGLKKQQKLRLLREQIGDPRGRRCLLVTCGDNNGALNLHLRDLGGDWTWVELEQEGIADMEALLGGPVLRGTGSRIPVEDARYDLAVSVDVHEHLEDCAAFNRELHRVVRPGGEAVVTTPNGDERKPVAVLKRWIGMTRERYGHRVTGYGIADHERMLGDAGFQPVAAGSYSKLFTEAIELAINFLFVRVLTRRPGVDVREGQISPGSRSQLRAVSGPYRLYAAVHPLLVAVSKLDVLDRSTGYAVSVVARKPA